LLVLANMSLAIYIGITTLSRHFEYGSDREARPLGLMIGLWIVASLLYLVTAWFMRKMDGRAAIFWGLVPAIIFRVVLLASHPIQEVDLYRYLWDGAVGHSGTSPYLFAPMAAWPDDWVAESAAESFVEARTAGPAAALQRVQTLPLADDGLRAVLRRVHFAHVSTVYPPVSQWGFHLVHAVTPEGSSVWRRITLMRVWLVICDLATLLVVMALLAKLGQPLGLAALYGWCPLVLKEVANSGHLDSMAVLCTTLAVYAAVRGWLATRPGATVTWGGLSGLLLAMGIAAKVYPLVLIPWLAVGTWRFRGLRAAVWVTLLVVAASYVLMRPMLVQEQRGIRGERQLGGLSTFARYWEMNDFLFLLVHENLKPLANREQKETAWFSVVPDGVRTDLINRIQLPFWPEQMVVTPFLASRLLTGIAYLLTMGWILYRSWSSDEVETWLNAAFLVIAWFFLWGPTQNPWYWLWAMPLIPFARLKAWWGLSGLLFLYYARFWFEYHRTGIAVSGTRYEGAMYFHLVFVWFEFAPWFLLLCGEYWFRRRNITRT
ncbi:MAG: hypothetical protein AAGF97_06620, partial [Planctomycetota bacterium]